MKRFSGSGGMIWALALCVGFGLATVESDAMGQGRGRVRDRVVRLLAGLNGMTALELPAPQPPAKVALGQALFFDRLLSGNKDTSCATCHHPELATGDGLALPVGTGTPTVGKLGLERVRGEGRSFVPRNAPEVFNRGDASIVNMFWDGRVEPDGNGGFISPAGSNLPGGLESLLAVQAMFPVTSRDEMRGDDGDLDVDGNVNEIAEIADDDLPAMWSALMTRILSFQGYRDMFKAAYDLEDGELANVGYEQVANAIAAFEEEAFSYDDAPWDEFLRGDDDALTEQQKRGALLFMTKARCVRCHNGPLLSDFEHYNIAAPQLGPGKAPEAPEDFGRFRETLKNRDLYRFRAPPLRNVEVTGPYFHDGAYKELADVIRHHADTRAGLYGYDPAAQLEQVDLRDLVVTDSQILRDISRRASIRKIRLSNNEILAIEAFLKSLTAPNVETRLFDTIPVNVPSGLEVERITPLVPQP